MKFVLFFSGITVLATALINSAFAAPVIEDSAWVQVFNGKDLIDWTPKFGNKPVGENVDSTFKVQNGTLVVDQHSDFSKVNFGHLFYTKRKYSYYMLHAEYKFTSSTPANGFPSWTNQNNGLMVLSEDPKGISLDGTYPNSIEVQLLGPKNQAGDGITASLPDWPVGHTANVCLVGSKITWNGNSENPHCIPSQYPDAWKGTQKPWDLEYSDVTVRVLSDSLITHTIHGAKVFEYSKPRKDDGTPMKDGYFAIQAEGGSTVFKKIEVLDLVGCMDKSKVGYRSYFVKSDPTRCDISTNIGFQNILGQNISKENISFTVHSQSVTITGKGILEIEMKTLNGKTLNHYPGNGKGEIEISIDKPGIYIFVTRTTQGTVTTRLPVF